MMIILMSIFLLAFFVTKYYGIELYDCGCGGIHIDPSPVYIILRDLAFLLAAIITFRGKEHIMALDNKLFK